MHISGEKEVTSQQGLHCSTYEYRKSARTSRKIYPNNRICKVGGRLLCTDMYELT